MPQHIKTSVLLIILIIIVIAGWLWYGASMNTTSTKALESADHQIQDQTATQQSAAVQNAVSSDGSLTTSATDTSDAALQSDLDSINVGMNNLNSDNTNVNQSIQ